MMETERFSGEFLSSLSYKRTKIELNNGDTIETNSICGGDLKDGKQISIMLNWGTPCADGVIPIKDRVRIPLEQIKSLTLLSQDSEKESVQPLHLASF